MEVLAGGGPTDQRYRRSGPGIPEAAGGASRPRADSRGSALAQFDHAAPAPLLARAPSMTAVSFDGRFGWLHLPDPAVGVRASKGAGAAWSNCARADPRLSARGLRALPTLWPRGEFGPPALDAFRRHAGGARARGAALRPSRSRGLSRCAGRGRRLVGMARRNSSGGGVPAREYAGHDADRRRPWPRRQPGGPGVAQGPGGRLDAPRARGQGQDMDPRAAPYREHPAGRAARRGRRPGGRRAGPFAGSRRTSSEPRSG